MFVEFLIDGRGVDGHVRVGILHGLDAFGSGDQHHGADVPAAGLFQQVDGGDHGAAGGEHRVNDHRQALVDFRYQFFQVGVRLQGLLVASHAHGADLGPRDQAQHALEHADAGAQDRHHGDLLAGDFLDLDRAGPTVDFIGLQRQVLGGLVSEQGTDFLGEFTEVLRANVSAAHQAEFVSDQRMADLEDGHGEGSGGGQKNRPRLIYPRVLSYRQYRTLVHKRLIWPGGMRTFAGFSEPCHPWRAPCPLISSISVKSCERLTACTPKPKSKRPSPVSVRKSTTNWPMPTRWCSVS
ncbi:hypothetical protein EMIT0P228_80065 [Pseudomonas brassicacearum]